MSPSQSLASKKIKKKKKDEKFSQHVAIIAGNSITKKGYVSVIDLFLGIGWLTKENSPTSEESAKYNCPHKIYFEQILTPVLYKRTQFIGLAISLFILESGYFLE